MQRLAPEDARVLALESGAASASEMATRTPSFAVTTK